MRQAELTKLCKKWQGLLSMSDWRIRCHFVDELSNDGIEETVGNCAWFTEEGIAEINIVRPERQLLSTPVMVSVEETLVHELLHLRLEGHKAYSGKYDRQYERALNAIAEALVRKKR